MTPEKHRPFVPENIKMQEFTWRALLLGLIMTVVLGAANAYLGLRAGITIAATYPAAVIGMAVLRAGKGTILEENVARTAGSIGESVAAGAIFTIPAFLISKSWTSFTPADAYWKTTVLMIVGSLLGVLFISLVRRVMVEDPELPFPESVAAAEIHKAGQRGAEAAKYLFWNMGLGSVLYLLGQFRLFNDTGEFFVKVGDLGRSILRLGPSDSTRVVNTGAITLVQGPRISPAYFGVGFIIGPKLASLQFAGGVLAWGLLVPMFLFFLGPRLQEYLPAGAGERGWEDMGNTVWRYIVRPIAVGGMLVGAAFTLFRMRKSLAAGLGRAVSDMRAPQPLESMGRTERYMSSKVVFGLIAVMFAAMVGLYIWMSGQPVGGFVAALVMLIVGFFFATVSGSLVGFIGSSNNPISGLTLSTLIIAAVLMVSLGVSGTGGVAVVLGVAAVVCVSSAVAGEMLQDFKVTHILGGTPRTIQIVELVSVIVASLVMYWPLMILYQGNINKGGIGFGDRELSAPQAGLMASLSQGIVGGEMAWPLVVTGVLFGIAMIMMQVRSPMLVAVGMYLPFDTTFAIFLGGILRWITDTIADRRGYNAAQKTRVENTGILAASGLIAGEALAGLVVAFFAWRMWNLPVLLANPTYMAGMAIAVVLGAIMIRLPLSTAGRADEPAPPTAMM